MSARYSATLRLTLMGGVLAAGATWVKPRPDVPAAVDLQFDERAMQAGCRNVHTMAHLHDVLFDVVGFVGNVDDYYNPANSYLPNVLRTRRGLPITLVLIYKCVAEQLGLTVRGINSPGHFLASVRNDSAAAASTKDSSWMYVDPWGTSWPAYRVGVVSVIPAAAAR